MCLHRNQVQNLGIILTGGAYPTRLITYVMPLAILVLYEHRLTLMVLI